MKDALWQMGIEELCEQAAELRDQGKGRTISYSLNVFLPLTRLCRNNCGYCDYRMARPITEGLFLHPEQVIASARAGEKAGCAEALLVSGDKPEQRYPAARRWLREHHFDSTAHFACEMARLVLDETRLFPHTNVGVANRAEITAMKEVNASIGLMLETTNHQLGQGGKPHDQSPDKHPQARLGFLANAGELGIPTTTGLLVGIGETRKDRVEAIAAIGRLHEKYGHIQEVIIQNFRPKRESAMAEVPAIPVSEILWTCSVARLLLGPGMNLQVAPNLIPTDRLAACLRAGTNDWGGISPLTVDFVNLDSPWPPLAVLRKQTEAAGFFLRQRFPVYPEFVDLLQPMLKDRVGAAADDEGYVRKETLVP